MPLHIEARINERRIGVLHIGRVEELRDQHTEYTYKVVLGITPDEPVEWGTGITFTHRYSDGAWVCVAKAVDALREAGLA